MHPREFVSFHNCSLARGTGAIPSTRGRVQNAGIGGMMCVHPHDDGLKCLVGHVWSSV